MDTKLASLPAEIISKDGSACRETFSTEYSSSIDDIVLRELGGLFLHFEGQARASIEKVNRGLTEYCKFLADFRSKEKLASISDLKTEDLNDYLIYLKGTYPTKHKNGKTLNPWYEKWRLFGRILSKKIDIGKFPYCPRPENNTIDGHTPYAMGMFLDALRKEIDIMREKIITLPDGRRISRWQLAVENGRILTLDWFEKKKPGRTSSYSKQQLDEFEKVIVADGKIRDSYREIAKKYNVDKRTPHSWRKKLELGLLLDNPLENHSCLEEFEILKEELSKLPIVADSLSAKKVGLPVKVYTHLRINWLKSGRPKEKFNPEKDIDVTIEDIIATIKYYLPSWPLDGKMWMKYKPHRVYQSANGVYLKSFKSKSEATAFAKKHDAVVAFDCKCITDSRSNPGELIMRHLQTASGGEMNTNRLAIKIGELLPGGLRGLVREYMPTPYDWGVVLLYWLCLTGWNLEAVRSIKYRDLISQLEEAGPHDLLSSDHAMIVSQTKIEDDILPMIIGEKSRGQPEHQPKLYTYISDRTEEYGLFRVLEDYCELTKIIRQHLDKNERDYVFVGASATHGKTLLSKQCYAKTRTHERQFKKFLDKNPIYEDVSHIKRVSITGARRLRVTYFTTLRSLDIPITTMAFLGGHKAIETTLIHYTSNKNSISINREKSRELLDTIAEKAFRGTLKRYEQSDQKNGDKNIQIFTHRKTDIMLCADRYNPTWLDNEEFIPRQASSKTITACEEFGKCLFCSQCIITEDTLPYLVRWFHDLREWRRKQGGGDFPAFMYNRYQAIKEVFDICEHEEYWQQALRRAEDLAVGDNFYAPPIWRSI